MRTLGILVVGLLLGAPQCLAQKVTHTIKIKLEANQWDSGLILEKLNDHGSDHGLRFETADQNYDYRITFATGQHKNTLLGLAGAGAVNYSKAGVTAYDAKGNELFNFQRENRYTDTGAANAAAKEIIKRLLKVRQSQLNE
jgi:hypothetical protein